MKIISLQWFTSRALRASMCLGLLAVLLMGTTFGQTANNGQRRLVVSLITDRSIYKIGDEITLNVLLTNISSTPINLYSYLAPGESASISVWVKDEASGRDIPQTVIADSITPPPPSKDVFIKLLPKHVYGVALKSTLANFGVEKQGRYEIIAEYHSPIPSSISFGLPIWSAEDGTLSSNRVTIAVGN